MDSLSFVHEFMRSKLSLICSLLPYLSMCMGIHAVISVSEPIWWSYDMQLKTIRNDALLCHIAIRSVRASFLALSAAAVRSSRSCMRETTGIDAYM